MSAPIAPEPAAATPEAGHRSAWAAVDVWDAAAHLESRGTSRRVATQQGHDSVFSLARTLREAAPAASVALARDTHSHRDSPSLVAALLRALVMLAGVAVCVTSVPLGTDEVTMFAVAAAGWLAGQAVSSSVWYAWGESSKADGLRTGLVVGGIVLLAAVAWVLARGSLTLLVWVGWGAALPILLTTMNTGLLALATAAVAAFCATAWAAALGQAWAPAALAPWGGPVALASTVAVVGLAAWLGLRAVRGRPARLVAGTPRAGGGSRQPTGAQLSILLMMFVGVGRGAFGAIALAGLAAGVLSDPLLTLGQAWTRRVVQGSTSWAAGRFRIGVMAVLVVLVLLAVSAGVAWWYLADPYQIHLNRPTIIVAAVLIGAVIAATNILLRTGAAVGAMVFALVAELLMAPASLAGDRDELVFVLLCAATALVVALALWQGVQRFARPSTW